MNTTTTKKAQMYADIKKHGDNLNAIFNTGIDSVKLCKKLFQLERKANTLTTAKCNGDYPNFDKEMNVIFNQLTKILFATGKNDELQAALFVNQDARGYALKIDSDYIKANDLKIHTDWGGDGIIAPDFSNN